MNSLNVYTVIDYDGEYSTQVWQYLYSYKQYKAYPNSTNIDIKFNKIELSNLPTLNKSVLSILHLSLSSLDVLEKVDIYKFIHNNKTIVCKNIYDMKTQINEILKNNCVLIEYITYSDSPEKVF